MGEEINNLPDDIIKKIINTCQRLNQLPFYPLPLHVMATDKMATDLDVDRCLFICSKRQIASDIAHKKLVAYLF